MATAVQLRRGTSAQVSAFTGLIGECVVDTTANTLVVGDGSTAGGFALARADFDNISASAALTMGVLTATQVDLTAQGDLRLQDAAGGQYAALQAPTTVSASYTLTMPGAVGSSGQVLRTSDGAGALEWYTPDTGDIESVTAGNGLTGGGTSGDVTLNAAGTADRISVSADAIDISASYSGQATITTLGAISSGTWNGTAVADSYVANDLTISGGTVDNSVIGGSTPAAGTFTQVDIEAQGDLRLQDSSGGEYVALQAPGTATSYTVTMPGAVGASGQALRTSDGSGTLEWYSPEVGDITEVIAGTGLSGGGSSGSVTLQIDASYTGQATITTVGALDTGSITSGFGSIDVGSSAITTTGAISGGSATISGTASLSGTVNLGDTASDDINVNGMVGTHIVPKTDDTYDLGSATKEWRSLYIDDTAYIDTLSAGTVSAGVWNGTAIANGYLANSTVSYGGVSLSLGGTDATPAFNLVDATGYLGTSSLVTVGTISSGTWGSSATAIANDSLANSTVSYGGVSLSLGGTDATPAFNLSDATAYAGDSSLVTVGTIGTGTWQGTAVAKAYVAGSPSGDYVGTSDTQVLAAKSLTSPAITGNVSGDAFLNEADFASNSSVKLASQASIKTYVDDVASGLDLLDSVHVASTAALTVTYDNGSSGVGATLTNAGTQAALSLDGQTLVADERVLVKDQASALQNGVYTVTNVGSGASNWIMTRATDFDTASNMRSGSFTFVETGSVSADSGWVMMTDGEITVGTTAINWTQFSSSAAILAGDGLTKVGSTIDAVGTADRISVNGAIDIDSGYVGQSSITTLGTLTTLTVSGTSDLGGSTLDNGGVLTLEAGGKLTTAAANDLNLDVPSSRSLFLKIGGSTAATLDGTGLGLGVTPVNTLHVGPANGAQMRFTNDTTGHTTSDGLFIGVHNDGTPAQIIMYENAPLEFRTNDTKAAEIAANTDFIWYDEDGSTAKMRWDASADALGIGIEAPQAPLDAVISSTGFAGKFTQSNTSNGDGLFVQVGSTASADYALSIRSNDGAHSGLAVKADGNVGIGTFSPASTQGYGHILEINDGDSGTSKDAALVLSSWNGSSAENKWEIGNNTGGILQFVHSVAADGSTGTKVVIDASGAVGISRTPSTAYAKLEVGGADDTALINAEASGVFAGLGVSNGGLGLFESNAVKVTVKSGNVGIGMSAPSAWHTDARSIQLGAGGSGVSGGGATNRNASLNQNAYQDTSGDWVYFGSDYAGRIEGYDGTWHFAVAASGTAGNDISFTEAMTILNSGAVGIGVAAPSEQLEVSDAAGADFSLVRDSGTIVDGDNLGSIFFKGNDPSASKAGALIQGKARATWASNNYDSALLFYLDDSAGNLTEYMRLEKDGAASVKSTDTGTAAGPILNLWRDSSSPADNDYIGEIYFSGENDAGGASNYAGMAARIIDASNSDEEGRLEIYTKLGGGQASRLLLTTETVINSDGNDTDFRVESSGAGSTTYQSHALFLQAGTGNFGVGDSDPQNRLSVAFADGSNVTAGNIADDSVTGLVLTNTTDSDGNGTMLKMQSTDGGNITAIGHIQVDGTSADMAFYTESSGTFSEKMRITADGELNLATNPPTTTTSSDLPILIRDTDGVISRDASFTWNPAADNLYVGTSTGTYIGSNLIRSGSTNALQLGTSAQGVVLTLNSDGTLSVAGNLSMMSNTLYANQMYVHDRIGHLNDGTAYMDFGVGTLAITGDTTITGDLTVTDGSNEALYKLDRIVFDAANYYVLNGSSTGVKLVDGATAWTTQSDENLKDNIVELDGALQKVKDIRCVTYNLKTQTKADSRIGFIAQDWEEDFGQVVDEDEDGTLGMRYTETIPVLLKAIQELEQRISQLEAN